MGRRTHLKTDWPFPHVFEPECQSHPWLRMDHDEKKEIQPACRDFLIGAGCLVSITDSGAGTLRGRIRGALGRAGRMDLIGQVMKGQAGAGGAGLVDIIGCTREARFIAIECKSPAVMGISPTTGREIISKSAGQPTEEQLAYLYAAHRRGAIAGVVWSVRDLERLWMREVTLIPFAGPKGKVTDL